MHKQLEHHYTQVAENYDSTWSHRPDYLDWMEAHIHARLDLHPGQWIGDIGAGTGLFLRRLMHYATPETPVVCVDPSQPMLDRLPEDPRLHPVLATAEDLVAGKAELPSETFDSIVIKEAVHHFTDPEHTLAGLADRLRPGGRLLIVTLPPRLEYPLFQSALDRFAANQPDPQDLTDALRKAGLTASAEFAEFPVRIDRELWVELVGGCWMSVLSSFSEDELRRGLAEIEQRHPEQQLEFPDRFAFITGRRP